MNTPDESLAALLGLLSSVLAVALYVWTALAVSAMFRKMGEEPWKAWVPFLNTATILKWGGFNPWLVLLSLIPIVQIVVFVLVVISAHRINPGFGYGNGMTVLAALLFVVWASILGFGPARWLGARATTRARPAAAAGPDARAGLAAAPPAATVSRVPSDAPGPRRASAETAGDAGDVHAPAAGPGPASADVEAFGGGVDVFAPPAPTAAAADSAWTPPDTTPRPSGAPTAHDDAVDAGAPHRTGADAASDASAPAPAATPPAGSGSDASWGLRTATPDADDRAASTGEDHAVLRRTTPPGEGAAPVSAVPGSGHAAADAALPDAAAPGDAGAHAAGPGDAVAVRDDAAPQEGAAAQDDDAAWPSEIDDVSAIYPSPFPPSPAGGRPYVGPPVAGLGESGGTTGRPAPAPEAPGAPIAFVPGRHAGAPAPVPPTPVTRVPAARRSDPIDAPAPSAAAGAAEVSPRTDDASPPAAIFARPVRSRRAYDADDPDAFPELSGEVSAVVGSPSAGAPRSASGAVSAQHRRSESVGTGDLPLADVDADDDADDVLDQTVIARRNVRPLWELVPASGSPVPLSASVVILGRRPSGDAAYPNAQLVAVPGDARTVSKTHARIELRGEAWVVTDLGSTNGVLVRTLMGDEVEVEPGGQLDAGERFFLGDEEFHLRRIAH